VIYLLDTNACIAIINDAPAVARERFAAALAKGATIAVSAVAAFELWYGAGKSGRREFNTGRVTTFLDGPVEIVPFDEQDAREAGRVRAALERKGTPIGAYDALIAGQALARHAIVVTANAAEFGRVAGLTREDWTR
jgi:tRNA(fMet)-specific endonuclease VapC